MSVSWASAPGNTDSASIEIGLENNDKVSVEQIQISDISSANSCGKLILEHCVEWDDSNEKCLSYHKVLTLSPNSKTVLSKSDYKMSHIWRLSPQSAKLRSTCKVAISLEKVSSEHSQCLYDNNKPCPVGEISCEQKVCDTPGDDEAFVWAVCQSITDEPKFEEQSIVSVTASGQGQTASCPSDEVIAFGWAMQSSNDHNKMSCIRPNNKLCDKGSNSCHQSACSTAGEDIQFIFIACQKKSQLHTSKIIGKTGGMQQACSAHDGDDKVCNAMESSVECPAGSEVAFGFGVHTSDKWVHPEESQAIHQNFGHVCEPASTVCSLPLSTDTTGSDMTLIFAVCQADLDYEVTPMYNLTVEVTDPTGLTGSNYIYVKLSDKNERPSVLPATLFIPENSAVGIPVGSPVVSYDPDVNQVLRYSIVGGNGADLFNIEVCEGQISVSENGYGSLDYESAEEYNLVVMVTDDGLHPPSLTDKANITVKVTNVNEPPQIQKMHCSMKEGDEEIRRQNNYIRIKGGSDALSGRLEYKRNGKWGLVCSKGFDSKISQINAETACKQMGLTGGIFIGNLVDFSVELRETPLVPVVGNLSCTSGNSKLYECDGYDRAPMCTAQQSAVLECTNPWEDICVMSNVTDPDDGDTFSFSILSGNVGTPQPLFDVEEDSGRLMVNNLAQPDTKSTYLNHEEYDSFSFILRVRDAGGLTDDSTITVAILDINEPPHLIESPGPAKREIFENSIVGSDIGEAFRAHDPDVGDQESLRYILEDEPSDTFAVETVSGQIVSVAPLDFESRSFYMMRLAVQDHGGLSDSIRVAVYIKDVNEAPIGVEIEVFVPEDADDGDSTMTNKTVVDGEIAVLSAVDVDDGKWGVFNFKIVKQLAKSQQGWDDVAVFRVDTDAKTIVVSGHGVLDYEIYSEYVVTVQVTDEGLMSSFFEVGVHIIDMNEPPVLAERMDTKVPENAVTGTIVLEAGAEYVDKPDAGQIEYNIIDGTHGSTDIFGVLADGSIVVEDGSELDYEFLSKSLRLCFDVTLEAKDKGIVGAEYNGDFSTPLSDNSHVKICVTDVPEPPVFPVPEHMFTVTVDAPENQNVGIPLVVIDQDFGDIVSISINADPFEYQNETVYPNKANGTGEIFGIDKNGQIFLRVSDVISEGAFMVLPIDAQDSYGLKASATVTVEVLPPANYAPTLNDTERWIDENSLYGPVGQPLKCLDDPRDFGKYQNLRYSIVSGNEDKWFEINPASGQLKVTGLARLNFEKQYSTSIIVECRDDGLGKLSDTAVVIVYANDINESPRPTKDQRRDMTVVENRPLNYIINGNFEEGLIITGLKRCLNTWACTHIVGFGADKYFMPYDDRNCPGCSVVRESLTPAPFATFSGYILQTTNQAIMRRKNGHCVGERVSLGNFMTFRLCYDACVSSPSCKFFSFGKRGEFGRCYHEVTNTGCEEEGWVYDNCDLYEVTQSVEDPRAFNGSNVLKVRNGVEMAISFPATIRIGTWIYVSEDYDGNETYLQAEFFAASPPQSNWRSSSIGKIDGNILQHPNCWPTSRGTWEYIFADFSIPQRTTHPEVKGVDENGNPVASPGKCMSPQEADTVRIVELSLTSSGSTGYIYSTGLHVEDVTTIGHIIHTDPDRVDDELKYSVVEDSSLFFIDSAIATERASMTIKQVAPGILSSLDYETLSLVTVTVKSVDSDSSSVEEKFLVHVCDRNDPPILADVELTVDENSPRGSPVGSPVRAFDEDFGQFLSYTIEGGNFHMDTITHSAPQLGLDGQGISKKNKGSDWHDIKEWLVLGKFEQKIEYCGVSMSSFVGGKESMLGSSIFPNADESFEGKYWKKWTTGADGLINFQDRKRGGWDKNNDHVAAYAFTYIYSRVKQTIPLGVGSDDGFKLWVNGKLHSISNANACRQARRAQDVSSISLKEGENTILIVVGEHRASWGARISIGSVKNVYAASRRVGMKKPDTPVEIQTAVFEFSSAINGQILVAGDEGQVDSSLLDYESQDRYKLFVRVTDDGFGRMSDTAFARVIINDMNEPPVICGSTAVTTEENISPFTVIASIDVEDEIQETLTYQVFPSDTFDTSEGRIILKPGASLNFEKARQHSLLVLVTDEAGLITKASFLVSVTDVNDIPIIRSQIRSIAENAGKYTNVGAPIEVFEEDVAQTTLFRISQQDKNGYFVIGEKSGQLQVGTAVLNYEEAKWHQLVLDVVDCDGLAGICDSAWSTFQGISVDITVQVIDVNEPPKLFDTTVFQKENIQPHSFIGGAIAATDPDTRVEQNLAYSIIGGSGMTVFKIEGCSGQLSLGPGQNLDYEGTRQYSLNIFVVDAYGLSDTAEVIIVVQDVNEKPLFESTRDYFLVDENVPVGSVVGQVGTAFDMDSPYSSKSTTSGEECLSWSTGIVSPKQIFDYGLQSNYCRYMGDKTSWCYTDSNVRSSCDHQDVVYNIRSDTNSFRIDPDSGLILVSSLGGISGLNFEGRNQYVLKIEACDTMSAGGNNAGYTAFQWSSELYKKQGNYEHVPMCSTKTVIVNVRNKNEPPTVRQSSLIPRKIREGSVSGTVGAPMSAYDEDGDEVSWWTDSTDGLFSFNTSTGEIKISLRNGKILNFEDQQQHTLNVVVGDRQKRSDPNILTTVVTVVVNILDVNEPPALVGGRFFVIENATKGTLVGSPLVLNDEDEGQSYSFQIIAGNKHGIFGVNDDRQVYVSKDKMIDYEDVKMRRFSLLVEVRDYARPGQLGAPSLTGVTTVEIEATEANESPYFPSEIDYENSFYEDIPDGSIIGRSILAVDPDINQTSELLYSLDVGSDEEFMITNNGSLSIYPYAHFDFEVGKHEFVVVVVATDPHGLQSRQSVLIKMLDSNEPPVLNETFRSIGENAQYGDLVGSRVIAEDEDLNGGQKISFRMNDTTNGTFGISQDGQFFVTKGPSGSRINPYLSAAEGFNLYEFSVCASDVGFGSPDFQVSQETCSWATITIFEENEPPILPARALSIDENSVAGSAVGSPVTGSDPDGDMLTYLISGGNAEFRFKIDNKTAQISLTNAIGGLDFERRNRYDLTVEVMDSGQGNLTTSAFVTVYVLDINEAPTAYDLVLSIEENLKTNSFVGNLLGYDTDADDRLSFAFKDEKLGQLAEVSADGRLRIISNSAEIRIASSSYNFEQQNHFSYLFVAIDSKDMLSEEATLSLLLVDANDRPQMPLIWDLEVPENSPNGERVGWAIPGNDEDSSSVLKYEIEGDNCWSGAARESEFSPPFEVLDEEDGGDMTFSVNAMDLAKVNLRSVDGERKHSFQIRLGERGNSLSRILKCNGLDQCSECGVFPVPSESAPLDFVISDANNNFETKATPENTTQILTFGDFGYKSAGSVDSFNCDDYQNCDSSKWSGQLGDSHMNMVMEDGRTFKIASIETETLQTSSRAFVYDIESIGICKSFSTRNDCLLKSNICSWENFDGVNKCVKNSCSDQNEESCNLDDKCKWHGQNSCREKRPTLFVDPNTALFSGVDHGETVVENSGTKNNDLVLGFSLVKSEVNQIGTILMEEKRTTFLAENFDRNTEWHTRPGFGWSTRATKRFLATYGDQWQVIDFGRIREGDGTRRMLCRPRRETGWTYVEGNGNLANHNYKGNWYVHQGLLRSHANAYGRSQRGRGDWWHRFHWSWWNQGTGVWYTPGTKWKNYVLSTRLANFDDDWQGIMFKVVDHNNYYLLEWSRQNRHMIIFNIINGRKYYVTWRRFSVGWGDWRNIEIHLKDRECHVHVSKFGWAFRFNFRWGFKSQGSVGVMSRANHDSRWDYIHVNSLDNDGGLRYKETSNNEQDAILDGSGSFTVTTWLFKPENSEVSKTTDILGNLLRVDSRGNFHNSLGPWIQYEAASKRSWILQSKTTYPNCNRWWCSMWWWNWRVPEMRYQNWMSFGSCFTFCKQYTYSSYVELWRQCRCSNSLSSHAEDGSDIGGRGIFKNTGSSKNLGYGASWENLEHGWNELTLRYNNNKKQITLFINGVGKPTVNLDIDDSYQLVSIYGEVSTSFIGHMGITYAYEYASSNDNIQGRYEEIAAYYQDKSCGTLRLEYKEGEKWILHARVAPDQSSNINDAPLSKIWRLRGFEEKKGFCVMARPKISGTKGMTADEIKTAALLKSGSFPSFWVRWDYGLESSGRLSFGTGSNPTRDDTTLMMCHTDSMFKIKYLALGSAAGQTAQYRHICYKGKMPQGYSALSEPLDGVVSVDKIFALDENTGQVIVSNAVLDFETSPLFSLKVSVTDGSLSETSTIKIHVKNRNEPPVVFKDCKTHTDFDQCKSVAENSPVGTLVGTPLFGIDQDADTYDKQQLKEDTDCLLRTSITTMEMVEVVPLPFEAIVDLSARVVATNIDNQIPSDKQMQRGSGTNVLISSTPRILFSPPSTGSAREGQELCDGKLSTVWTSSIYTGTPQYINLDVGEELCFNGINLQWAGNLNAQSVTIGIVDKDGLRSVVHEAKELLNTEDRVDNFVFSAYCGKEVFVRVDSFFRAVVSIAEIEIIEANDVFYVSQLGSELIFGIGATMTLTKVESATPTKGTDCDPGRLNCLQYWDERNNLWNNVSIDDTAWTISRPVQSSSFKLIVNGKSAENCVLSVPRVFGFTDVMTLGGELSIAGTGASTFSGLMTDGTDVWIANGDGSMNMVQRSSQSWHSECVSKSINMEIPPSLSKRSTGYTLSELNSQQACFQSPLFSQDHSKHAISAAGERLHFGLPARQPFEDIYSSLFDAEKNGSDVFGVSSVNSTAEKIDTSAGLVTDGRDVYYINVDKTHNKIFKPSKECIYRATRGVDVSLFPKRTSGYTLPPLDSQRACAGVGYTSRVMLNFPEISACTKTVHSAMLNLYVARPGTGFYVCLANKSWETHWNSTVSLAEGNRHNCYHSSSTQFDSSQVGWQALDITKYFNSVQSGVDNNGIVLFSSGLDGISFYTNSHMEPKFFPSIILSFGVPLPLSWRILGGNVGDTFDVVVETGQLLVKNDIIDYEDDTVQGRYELLVSATDEGGLDDTGSVIIIVEDVNEPPVCSDVAVTVNENSGEGAYITSLLASDPDAPGQPASTLRYSIQSVIGTGVNYLTKETSEVPFLHATSSFFLDPDSGELDVGNLKLNFEGKYNNYYVTVEVSDKGDPSRQSHLTVRVMLADINEPPSLPDQHRTILENSPIDKKVGDALKFSDPDADQTFKFTIMKADNGAKSIFKIESCSGQLFVAKSIGGDGSSLLDFESEVNRFKLEIQVTDNGIVPSPLSGKGTVTIEVEDVNELPQMFESELHIQEHPIRGLMFDAPVSGADVDKDQTSKLKYSIAYGNAGNCGRESSCPLFTIEEDTGILAAKFAGTPKHYFRTNSSMGTLSFAGIPFLSPLTYFQYNETVWSGSLALNHNSIRFYGYAGPNFVLITSTENEFPTLMSGTNLRVKLANDFEYILSSWQNGVTTTDVLDFESKQIYKLTIRVTDMGKLTHETEIKVIVDDVNEPPVFSPLSTFEVFENIVSGDQIGVPISVRDDQFGISKDLKQSFTYSLVGNEKGKFRIDRNSGVVFAGDIDNYVDLSNSLFVRAITNGHVLDTKFVLFGDYPAEVGGEGPRKAGILSNAAISYGIVNAPISKYFRVVSLSSAEAWSVDVLRFFSSTNCSGTPFPSDQYLSSHDDNKNNAFGYQDDIIWSTAMRPESNSYIGMEISESSILRSLFIRIPPTAVGSLHVQSSPDGVLWTSLSRLDFDGEFESCHEISPKSERQFNIAKVQFESDSAFPTNACTSFSLANKNDEGQWMTVLHNVPITVNSVQVKSFYSDEWKFFDFKSEGSWCKVSVKIYGKELGQQWAQCAIGSCESAHVDGSPYHVVARKSCSIGCDIAAFGLSTLRNGTTIKTCRQLLRTFYPPNDYNVKACNAAKHQFNRITYRAFDAEGKNEYTVKVRVQDINGAHATQNVQIKILDVDEPPSFSNSVRYSAENVARGMMIGAPIKAADFDAGTYGDLEYSILKEEKRVGTDWVGIKDAFDIVPSSGQLKVKSETFDYEKCEEYRITVRATDKGRIDANAAITVFIEDVNEVPVLPRTSSPDCPFGWDRIGSETSSMCCLGGCNFESSISQTEIGKNSIHTRICSTASNKLDRMGWEPCTQYRTTFILDHLSGVKVPGGFVDENSAPGTLVGRFIADPVDKVDIDLDYTIRYGDEAGNFKIDSLGNIKVATADIDYEEAETKHHLTIKSCDKAKLCTSGIFMVQVVDVNEAPIFYTNYNAAVKENAQKGTVVGPRILADDEDRLTLKYTDPHGTSCCGSTDVFPGSMWKMPSYQNQHCLQNNVKKKCQKDLKSVLQVFESNGIKASGDAAWISQRGFNCSLDNNDQIDTGYIPGVKDAATCKSKCQQHNECVSWQYNSEEPNECLLFSTDPLMTTDNTKTCGFNRVSIGSTLEINPRGKNSYISISTPRQEPFYLSHIRIITPEWGENCNNIDVEQNIEGFWSVVKRIKTDEQNVIEAQVHSTQWRLAYFGGNVDGPCHIKDIKIGGVLKDDLAMAALDANYIMGSSHCEVCHKCFLKCGRYSDNNRYRFKACAGTSTECSRQSTKADMDGEVTFLGKPFQSEITSLRVGTFTWSGARKQNSQTANQLQSRRLSQNENEFSLRLTGLSFDRFVESADAKRAAALKIAESLGIDVKRLKINGVRKGSVIIDFEVIDTDDDGIGEDVKYERFYQDHGNGALRVSLQSAMSNIQGIESTNLGVAELEKSEKFRRRELESSASISSDWECYVNRYADIQVATEQLARQHWDKTGDAEGRLWGCFNGYYDSPTSPTDFVFTTSSGGWNERAMKPNIKLFLGESMNANGGFMYLTTFEQSSETLKKRVVEMPLTYSIVGGNDKSIFTIDSKTGQVSIETEDQLDRAKKDS